MPDGMEQNTREDFVIWTKRLPLRRHRVLFLYFTITSTTAALPGKETQRPSPTATFQN